MGDRIDQGAGIEADFPPTRRRDFQRNVGNSGRLGDSGRAGGSPVHFDPVPTGKLKLVNPGGREKQLQLLGIRIAGNRLHRVESIRHRRPALEVARHRDQRWPVTGIVPVRALGQFQAVRISVPVRVRCQVHHRTPHPQRTIQSEVRQLS